MSRTIAWPWCNFAASQRRPYCGSAKSHSPVGLVSRQWDAVDRACVLCDRHIHNFPHFKKKTILALGITRRLREPNLSCRGADGPSGCYVLPKKKALHDSCRMGRRIDADSLICSLGHCECDSHTVHKLSQRRLTAGWLAPRESHCSRTRTKVSSDCLPSYVTVTRPVLEIFKMAGYFPDRPHICAEITG